MKILLTEKEIAERVAQLGREITETYRGKELTVVTIMNGAVIFAADLLRKIDLPLHLDSFAASSYENDRSSGKISVRSALKLPVRGRHVLLVDDILDTGLSMKYALDYFRSLEAASVRTCVLMDKMRKDKVCTHADWVGFRIPDRYVVGYGLDSGEYYRNLPYVGILTDELDKRA